MIEEMLYWALRVMVVWGGDDVSLACYNELLLVVGNELSSNYWDLANSTIS